LGRPATAAAHTAEIQKLHRAGLSKSEIARLLAISGPRCDEFWADLFL
jgi:hypothetical protein